MALAASNFPGTFIKKWPLAPGLFAVTGKFIPTTSYNNNGEILTSTLLLQICGLTTIHQMTLTPLGSAAGTMAHCWFDHNVIANTQLGRIHIFDALPAHVHDILLKGSGTIADAVGRDSSDILVKVAATDKTLAGVQGTKNIQNNTILTTLAETGSTNNFSGVHSRFMIYGN